MHSLALVLLLSTPPQVEQVEQVELGAKVGALAPNLSRAGEALFLTWLQPSTKEHRLESGPQTYAYDVQIARSRNGRRWRMLGALHNDGTQTEHGFAFIFAYRGRL